MSIRQHPKIEIVAQMVKNLKPMQETQVQPLGWKDLLEKEMATHSSILTWRIPMDRGAWWATLHESQRVRMTEKLTFLLFTLKKPYSYPKKKKYSNSIVKTWIKYEIILKKKLGKVCQLTKV